MRKKNLGQIKTIADFIAKGYGEPIIPAQQDKAVISQGTLLFSTEGSHA
jgi:hypothetical protein